MFCDDKNKDEAGLRLTFESYGRRYSFESAYSDEGIDEIMDAFFGMLTSSGWHPLTVVSAMERFVESNKYIYAQKDETEDNENNNH